jgi:leucyl-tRNA synthetase
LVNKWRKVLGKEQSAAGVVPNSAGVERKLRQKTHQTIKRVSDNLETLQFNTPVAALMELANAIGDFQVEPDAASEQERDAVAEALTALVLMLTPFAPHVAEELYANLTGSEAGILASGARFPAFSEELAKADEIEIPVQVNGKLRSRILAPPDAANDELQTMAFGDEKIAELVAGKDVIKVIVVPGRLVNIVVK